MRSGWIGFSCTLLCACAGTTAGNTGRALAPAQVSDDRGATDEALAGPARVEPWPQATARFHANAAWLGADSAYSVELSAGRVLWLFADTFIDPAADGSRTHGPNVLIRNSVAIQSDDEACEARDLSESQLRFYWGHAPDGAPTSFFQDVDSSDGWVWPLHGARLDSGALLLFRMHLVKADNGLGFREDGWGAVAVDEPDLPPEAWRPRPLTTTQRHTGKLIGSSVLIHEDFLYAYAAASQTPDHPIYLARWPLAALTGLRAQALEDPQWWTQRGFMQQSALTDGVAPAPLFTDGQIELSVHYDADRQRFVEIQMQGLFVDDPNTQIALRTAARPEGPWSQLTPLFRPPEHELPNAADLVAYAAKAHPEQLDHAWLLTYVVNDLKRFPPEDRLYYPQVLRVLPDIASASDGPRRQPGPGVGTAPTAQRPCLKR